MSLTFTDWNNYTDNAGTARTLDWTSTAAMKGQLPHAYLSAILFAMEERGWAVPSEPTPPASPVVLPEPKHLTSIPGLFRVALFEGMTSLPYSLALCLVGTNDPAGALYGLWLDPTKTLAALVNPTTNQWSGDDFTTAMGLAWSWMLTDTTDWVFHGRWLAAQRLLHWKALLSLATKTHTEDGAPVIADGNATYTFLKRCDGACNVTIQSRQDPPFPIVATGSVLATVPRGTWTTLTVPVTGSEFATNVTVCDYGIADGLKMR